MMNDQPTNHKEIIALIKKISGQANFIGAPRLYVDLFDGDLVAAVWLNQVVYWDGRTSEPIGFYKTYAEWKKELGLSEYQVRRVAMDCQRRGLVNILFRKVYGTPKLHYLVIWPELLKVLKATLEKPVPEETEGSETQGSEDGESKGSKEAEETKDSLGINEITTKTDAELKILDLLEDKFYLYDWWKNFQARIEHGTVRQENQIVIISGLGENAAFLQDRYTSTLKRALQISQDIKQIVFIE